MTTPLFPFGRHSRHSQPTLTVRHGILHTDLKSAAIASITLCESHVPGCVELLIDHVTPKGEPVSLLVIHARERCTNGVVTVTATKGEDERFVELRFTGLETRLAKLLETGITYSYTTGGQQQILFVPFPRTEAQMAKVGAVIAGAPDGLPVKR